MPGDPRTRQHAALDGFLSVRQAGTGKLDQAAFTEIRKAFAKPELVAMVLAIYQRLDWSAAHRDELADASSIEAVLVRLAHYLYEAKLPFAAPELCAMLAAHRRHAALWFVAPPEIVAGYLAGHDLTPALATEIRNFQADFQAALRKAKYTGEAALQKAQQHLHILRWHDEWDEIDLEHCWSEIIRRDLRAMTGEHRARWKAVLRQIKGNAPTKPAASWVKAAESRLASLGIEEFRGRMRDWLAPLRAAEPSPLSVAGSHVLRGLLWYAALARDPAIGEAALWVVDAAWKPKRRAEKVVVALVPLLEGMPPETAWPPLQQLQRQWPMPGGQIERLLKKVAAGLEIDEAELRHQGLLTPTPETPSVAASMDRLMAAAARLQRRLPD